MFYYNVLLTHTLTICEILQNVVNVNKKTVARQQDS